jgi:hypothetical protein
MYVVHIGSHHQNSASVFGGEVFGRQRIGNLLGIEARPFVSHHKKKFAVRFASEA